MNKKIEYWKWKNTIIDFNNISNEKDEYGGYATKKDIVFHYLGTPDDDVHEWYNGGFSSEYNTALRYAKQLGLVEDYIDYEEELYTLKSRIDKAIEYVNNYDVFKEFSFPLMKREEENQIKTSIKYEFDTSIKKDLLEILKGKE